MILVIFFTIFIFLLILEKIIYKKPCEFNYYFGVPGSGKTTVAAWLTKKDLKKKKNVYSNVPLKGAYKIDVKNDIGKFLIENGRLIIDEAGVELNNRNYKNMSPDEIKFYKYYRHFKVSIDVFSQSSEDADITLRRLATQYYLLKKSLIPFCVTRRRILKRVGIDKETGQIREEYYFQFLFGRKLIFAPSLWKMFNTESTYELPKKEFKKYE